MLRSSRQSPSPELTRPASVRIVPMRRRHVAEVVEIERQIFPQPWSPTLYLSELALGRATRRYYVGMVQKAVIGYAGLMVMVGEGHVTTIGVAPSWQHHGVGRRLLYELANEARAMGAQSLTLEVRMSNVAAQQLYQAFGFVPGGRAQELLRGNRRRRPRDVGTRRVLDGIWRASRGDRGGDHPAPCRRTRTRT